MRIRGPLFCLAVALLSSGCADSKWSFLRSRDTVAVSKETPRADQLVSYLNANAQRLETLQCQDLDIDVRFKLQSYGVRGWMMCQQPRNFRMQADFLGKTGVDIGSNDREFWYWMAKNEPPYLVHCDYQDLARGVQLPFPFQPEWVMEALGMAQRDPSGDYKVTATRDTFQLVQQTRNSQGQPVRKITVFGRDPSRVQVRDHILQDSKGKDICSAHIVETQYVESARAVVPKKVVLSWPEQHLQLTMKLGDMTVNRAIDRNWAAELFTRPALKGVQSYDLVRGLDGGGQVRPATGGFYSR